MKIRTFTYIITMLFTIVSFTNLNAKTESLVYENNYTTITTATTIEKMLIDKQTNKPSKRMVYERNTDNHLQQKLNYVWIAEQGWLASQKYEYLYNTKGLLTQVQYSEWNKSRSAWIHKQTINY